MSVTEMATGFFNNEFWKNFNIGHVIIIVTGLIGWGRLNQQFDDFRLLQQQQGAQISNMDTAGTHRSHETDATQQQQIDELNRRVTNAEQVLRELVPKMERVDANVLTLMARDNKR